jgi:hypothetical protein
MAGDIDLSAPDLRIDPTDNRIDVGAKFALQRMLKVPDTAVDAARLIRGINGETLAGIFGDDLAAAVKVAQAHGTQRWLLVPKGEDAALVMDAAAPLDAPPTIIFRGDTPDIRKKPARLDPALQKASQTFELFQRGELGLCATGPSAVPVSNLFPPEFCHLPSRDMVVLVTEEETRGGLSSPPVSGAAVRVVGPGPSVEFTLASTDESGQAQFEKLALGSYQVGVDKQGFEPASAEVVLTSSDERAALFGDASGSSGTASGPSGTAKVVPIQLASTIPAIEAFIVLDRSRTPIPTFVGPTKKIKWADVQFQWKLMGQFSETKLFLTVRHKKTGQQVFRSKIRDKNDTPSRPLAPVDNEFATGLPATPVGVLECELQMTDLKGNSVDKKKLQITLENSLVICDGRGVPLFGRQRFLPGERVRFKVAVEPDAKTLKDIQWTIPGRAIADYDIQWSLSTTPPSGPQVTTHASVSGLTAAQLKSDTVDVIWTEGLSKGEVKVKADFGSGSTEVKLPLTVPAPDMVDYTSTTTEILVGNFSSSLANVAANCRGKTDICMALIGETAAPLPGAQRAGIVYSATVRTGGEVSGHLGYIQLVKTTITAKSPGGSITSFNSGDFVLDDQLQKASGVNHPDNFFYPSTAGALTEIFPNRAASISREDSPSINLNKLNEVDRSDEFRTYLMFRSKKPGSVPIALGRLEWHWHGIATRIGKTEWKLLPTSSRSKDPTGVKITGVARADRLPTWTKSITN